MSVQATDSRAGQTTVARHLRVADQLDRRPRQTPQCGHGRRSADLIECHLPIARSLAHRYAGRGIDQDDLEQVAFLGLIKAATRFDPERGEDFLSFAIPTIRGELRRHFRDAGWMVRPTRRVYELQTRVREAELRLTQSLNRRPTVAELAADCGAWTGDVVESLTVDGCFRPASLDAPQAGGITLLEELGTADGELGLVDLRLTLAAALRTLSRRDRYIVRLRFVDELTQAEIGARIGVTQMQVSRLLSRILADLRAALTTDESDESDESPAGLAA